MRTSYPWSTWLAALSRQPGRWVMVRHNVPARTAKRVRQRAHPDLRHPDGYLQARIVNPYKNDEGSIVGDLWLRYQPHPVPPSVGESKATDEEPQ